MTDRTWRVAVSVGCLLAAVVSPALGEVKLPKVFADGMVLQQDMKVPIWGTAAPGEKVTVTFGDHKATAVADDKGAWRTTIGPLAASDQPAELTVAGTNALKLANVLVGEVWVCSGQSNMAWSVRNSNNADAEIADAKNYPLIRLCTVARTIARQPADDARISWAVCDPQSVRGFSAVGYFFGRELHKRLQRPVGLVHSSWGGTPAEAWTSRTMLATLEFMPERLAASDQAIAGYDPAAAQARLREATEKWKKQVEQAKAEGKRPPRQPRLWDPTRSPHTPSVLFNGMIAPIVPYGIRGAIWYQGESNAGRPAEYRTLMPALIRDWRRHWGQGDFPFLLVQLANFRALQPQPSEGGWALLREAQLMTVSALPAVGMATAVDIGEANDIHPKNKQDVGRRLALAAMAIAYGQKLVYSGPVYKSMKVADGKIVLSFDHVGGGLVALLKPQESPYSKSGPPLRGFAIAGADKQWVWADAKIVGDTVVVASEKVPAPVAVRYGWANNPIGNLYNKQALPASPFRTDDWEQ